MTRKHVNIITANWIPFNTINRPTIFTRKYLHSWFTYDHPFHWTSKIITPDFLICSALTVSSIQNCRRRQWSSVFNLHPFPIRFRLLLIIKSRKSRENTKITGTPELECVVETFLILPWHFCCGMEAGGSRRLC